MECLVYKLVRRVDLSVNRIKQIVNFACMEAGVRRGLISVHLIGDKGMIRLNKQYRGIRKTTDVLAFALQSGLKRKNGVGGTDWGDIFICTPQVRRQAVSFGESYRKELSRVLIHGTLHLLGCGHNTKIGAETMFALQEKILEKII